MNAYEQLIGAKTQYSHRISLKVELSPGVNLFVDVGTGPAAILSPDGIRLAFVGVPEDGGERRIYVRQLDRLEAEPLPGTEGERPTDVYNRDSRSRPSVHRPRPDIGLWSN